MMLTLADRRQFEEVQAKIDEWVDATNDEWEHLRDQLDPDKMYEFVAKASKTLSLSWLNLPRTVKTSDCSGQSSMTFWCPSFVV